MSGLTRQRSGRAKRGFQNAASGQEPLRWVKKQPASERPDPDNPIHRSTQRPSHQPHGAFPAMNLRAPFRSTAIAAALSLGLLAVLAACGGGTSSGSSSDSASGSSTDATSSAAATTEVATMSATAARGTTTSAPVIGTQPASQAVAAGSAASFSVAAYGAATLSYQWYHDGTAIGGANAATLAIATASSADAGSYHVVVTNAKGTATSAAATLSVSANVAAGAQAAASLAAAQSFIATLSGSQQATAVLPWNLDTARHWSNLPAAMVSRNGLAWSGLSTAQRTAMRNLVATALGSTGAQLLIGMQAADNYLYSIGGGSSYGEGLYYLSFLGTPSASGFWMLQVTGHHLTYNVAFNGSVKSATPMFLAVEPKAAFTYGGVGYDPMAAQRLAVASLGSALTGYSAAKLSGTYSDLVFGANGSGNIDGSCPHAYAGVTDHGLPYASLSSAHQALAQAVIQAYVATQSAEYASELLAAYLSDAALAKTYVAYAGSGTVTTRGDYFRLEGPRLWIEFSVQNGVIVANDIHYHTIWRDKTADYGGLCATAS